MGELGALFNPGMRHEIAERRSKASRREEEGNADPDDLRIDLLSGVAVISMGGTAGQPAKPAENAAADTAQDSHAGTVESPEAGTEETPVADNRDDENDRDDSDSADDRGDENVRDDSDSADDRDDSGDRNAASTAPTADSGNAPRANRHTDASADSEVDQAALEIAESTSNDETPT